MPSVEAGLLEALDAVSGDIDALAGRVQDRVDATRPEEDDPKAREQFLRAFLALLREGLEGGREQRELVMSTAVPALVAAGRTPEDLVHVHVAFFMTLSPRMLEHVPAERREESALWLAAYAAGYTREVLQIAQQAGRA